MENKLEGPKFGNARAELDRLYAAAYEELRRLAAMVRRGEPGQTLSTTALVNEAWLKLAASPELGVNSKLHFKRIAARAMRQLLVEAARRRQAVKRGEGAPQLLLNEELDAVSGDPEDLLLVDLALEELARLNPRQAAIVEQRFFGGLEVAETAELLGVSEATVQRDWRLARAWLASQLPGGAP